MFFLQMAGFPGSGKSTLAKEIARRTNAVVIDHDIVKTALLNAMNADEDPKKMGGVSYDIEWALVDALLGQGHNVILDSPCLYGEMIEKGLTLTRKHQALYKHVECLLDDFDEVNRRLAAREALRSQISQVASKTQFRDILDQCKRPEDVACLQVDTSQPMESYIDTVCKYVQSTVTRTEIAADSQEIR